MVESDDLYCEEQRIRHLDLTNEVGLSMVFIREPTDFAKDDLAVFPPINHENLYIDGDRESPSQSSSPSSSSSRLSDSSSSSFSPSDSDIQFEFDRKSHSQPSETVGNSRCKSLCYYSLLEIAIVRCWWKLLLARLLSSFQKFATWFSRNNLCSFSRTLRSFYPILGIVIWWWMRNRARRRLRQGEIAAHLKNTIKERDEVGW